MMLDHARNLDDLPVAEGGADDPAQGRALVVAQSGAEPGAIDPETASDLLPYLRNSKKMAPPSKAEKAKRRVLARVSGLGERYDEWKLAASRWLDGLDLAPDLAEDVGSRRWFRGLGTMVGLGALALAFWPDLTPLEARPAMPQDEEVRSELRSQMILPLALTVRIFRRKDL
jgi:hypothetical protein